MFRRKDFILMDVFNLENKKIGAIEDVILNINAGRVIGFSITSKSMFMKSNTISKEDIISFGEYMIINKISDYRGVKFSKIKNLDVIDNEGIIIGVLQDIVFDSESFDIKGLVINRGFVQNIRKGKKIVLQGDYIVGEKNIYVFNKTGNVDFVSKFHFFTMETDEYEKNI